MYTCAVMYSEQKTTCTQGLRLVVLSLEKYSSLLTHRHTDIQTRPDHGQMSALLYRLDDVMTGNELQ